jgi:FtsZ-binding cell division protein ZapB
MTPTDPTPPPPAEAKKDMSEDAIRSLNRRIDELMQENANLKSEAKDRRHKGRKLQSDYDALVKERDGLATDRDTWKGKAEAKSPELTTKIQELEGVIRTGKHQSAFNEAAAKHGIDPTTKEGKQALADLWTLSGYKAEGDEADPAKLDALIQEQKVSRPLLFGKVTQAEEPPATPPVKQKLQLPLDNSRGGQPNAGPQAFKVNSANLQDLGWMTKNAAALKAAKEAGTLVYE